MKKVLLLMIGAIVACAAHAQIYLLGDNVASGWTTSLSNHWDPSQPIQLSLSDGYYCFTAQGEFKLSTAKSSSDKDWTTYQKGALVVGDKSDNRANWSSTDPYSATMLHQEWGANNTAPSNAGSNTVYYRVKQNGNTYTIEATTTLTNFTGTVVNPDPIVISGRDKEYTVYLINKSDANMLNVHAYVWNGSDKRSTWPGETVTFDDTYITIDGKQYQVWVYTFYWNIDPKNIKFSGYGMNESGNLNFTNGKFYVYDGNSTSESNYSTRTLEARKTPDGNTTIYMHFKEDYLREAAKNREGDKVLGMKFRPKCHFYKDNYTAPTEQANEEMFLVSDKYQIWGYDIPTSDLNNYNQATFYFYEDQDKTPMRQYNTNAVKEDGQNRHDTNNWSKFIYATQNGGLAPQTYLSYQRFRELEKQGRPCAYIVGATQMSMRAKDENGNIQSYSQLGWTPLTPKRVYPEDGCFYLELTPDFNALTGDEIYESGLRRQMGFKVGWIDVAAAKTWANPTASTDHKQRIWATFDLGIIGANDLDSRCSDKIDFDVYSGEKDGKKWPGQLAKFHMNTSVSYLNYNQYNWTLVEGVATNKQPYYAVIDTHSECRSVTLCSFNPQPSVTVHPSQFMRGTLDQQQAVAMHNHNYHLSAATQNGHILMNKVNFCHGVMEIHGAANNAVNDAGFTPTYTVTMNGQNVLEYPGRPAALQLEYMPLATATDMSIRAKYSDKDTHITFHSRIGSGTLSGQDNFSAPNAAITDASFVFYNENYHIMAPISYSVDTDFNVYSDYTIDNVSTVSARNAAGAVNHEITHADHEMVKALGIKHLANWTPNRNDDMTSWTQDADWSSKVVPAETDIPVLIHDVYSADEYPMVDNKFPTLPRTSVNGTASAVYPFLYNETPKVTVLNSYTPNTDEIAVTDGTVPSDLSSFALTNLVRSQNVSAELTSRIVSGVEDIEADNSDAPVEYFTVAGVRVAGEPTPGIYLRRQGSKVEKVVIR